MRNYDYLPVFGHVDLAIIVGRWPGYGGAMEGSMVDELDIIGSMGITCQVLTDREAVVIAVDITIHVGSINV